MRPKSERETARLIAKEHMAREGLAHLVRTDGPSKEVESAARTAQGLKAALEKTVQARRRAGKEKLPAPTYTIEEGKRLVEYKRSREVVRDERAAARVVAQQKMAQAEARHAQVKTEGFELRRHLWKFDIEGWEGKISLKDVEQQIHAKHAEKLKVVNFIRPSKREMIQGQIDYLREVKADIQKQLAGMRELIGRSLKAAELRHDVARDQVEQARGQRAAMGRGMPGPRYSSQELTRLAEIANTDKDADLLRHVHEVTKVQIPADRERAGLMVGRSLMARLEMLKAHDRMRDAREYELVRHVAVRDEKGGDHSGSVREIKPRTLAEMIENRLMRPSEERAALNEQAWGMAREQVKHSEREFVKARDYFEVRGQIAEDYSRAAGLRLEQVTPVLSREQIEEMRDYVASGKLDRQVTQKREFEQAIPLAEDGLKQREARQAAREYQADRPVPGRQREPSLADQQERERVLPVREDYSRGR